MFMFFEFFEERDIKVEQNYLALFLTGIGYGTLGYGTLTELITSNR